ncbi:MAG TPA: glycosyltransferase family 87 protein, partial [Candidatus Dormibacteraeota bacterium]
MTTVERAAPASARGWSRAAVALAALGAGEALAQAVRGWRGAPHSDFVGVATAGRMLNAGSRCIYCLPAEAHAQTQLLGHPPDIGVMPYANPPLAAWLLRPVAALPLSAGVAVFLAISVVAMAVSSLLLARLMPALPGRTRLVVAAAAATVAPGLTALTYVQWAPLLLLAAVGAVLLVDWRGGIACGLLLSLLIAKPQDVWLVVPALLLAGRWRTLAAMASGALVWAVTTLAIVGVGGLGEWYRSNVQMDVGDSVKTAGVPGLVAQLTGHPGMSFPVAVVCALAAVGLLWRLRDRLHADPALAV